MPPQAQLIIAFFITYANSGFVKEINSKLKVLPIGSNGDKLVCRLYLPDPRSTQPVDQLKLGCLHFCWRHSGNHRQ